MPVDSFAEFDRMMERAYTEDGYANRIQPSTLEGNVVRVADIIAYLGKDRQDAARVKMTAEDAYAEHEIGSLNAEIINNLVVNIIENSYGKPYIKLVTVHFEAAAGVQSGELQADLQRSCQGRAPVRHRAPHDAGDVRAAAG